MSEQPRRPIARLGLTDGSVPRVDPATRRDTRQRAAVRESLSRESDADATRMTPMREAARCDLFFGRVDSYSLVFVCRPNAPAHLRRRASAQPVVNDAELPNTPRSKRAAPMPKTLHPFTAGCM